MTTSARRFALRRFWASAFLVLLGFALYSLRLGYKSLWIDEADSVYFAQHAWPDLIWRLCDPHPPGYYALLKVALIFGGSSEFAVRMPSALAGALAVAVMARLSRGLETALDTGEHGPSWTWLSTALFAVAPLHVWYAQEARMYAFVALFGLGAAVFLVRLARRWHWRDALSYLGIAAAGLTIDQSLLFPLVLANLGFLLISGARYRRSERRRTPLGPAAHSVRPRWWLWAVRSFRRSLGPWAGVQLGVAAVFGLWGWRSAHTGQVSSSTAYPLTMLQLVLARLEASIGTGPLLAVVSLVTLGSVGAGFALVLGRFRRLPDDENHRSIELGLQGLVFAVWCLVTIASVVPRLYTLKRLALGVLPYALLLAGWSMARLFSERRRWLRYAVLGFSLVMGLLNVVAISKQPWRDVMDAFAHQVEVGDIIWVDDMVVPVFDYYSQGQLARRVLWVDRLDEVAASVPDRGRLWFVVGSRRYRDVLSLFPNLGTKGLVWADSRADIELRGYDVREMSTGALAPVPDVPTWMQNWPSPLDDSCSSP